MPVVGHGPALLLSATNPVVTVKGCASFLAPTLGLWPFYLFQRLLGLSLTQSSIFLSTYQMLLPDWKGRRIDFSFQLENVLTALTLSKAISLSCQSLSLFAVCTVLVHFSGIFFLYFFSVASHLAWPCALTLSKPSRASQPTRIMTGTKTEMWHWLLAGWQIPGRPCSWARTGAAWPIFPGLRIVLTQVNKEHMVLILRCGDLCQELCLFLSPDFIYKMKIPGRHRYSEKDNVRTVVSDPWKEAVIALG